MQWIGLWSVIGVALTCFGFADRKVTGLAIIAAACVLGYAYTQGPGFDPVDAGLEWFAGAMCSGGATGVWLGCTAKPRSVPAAVLGVATLCVGAALWWCTTPFPR